MILPSSYTLGLGLACEGALVVIRPRAVGVEVAVGVPRDGALACLLHEDPRVRAMVLVGFASDLPVLSGEGA